MFLSRPNCQKYRIKIQYNSNAKLIETASHDVKLHKTPDSGKFGQFGIVSKQIQNSKLNLPSKKTVID